MIDYKKDSVWSVYAHISPSNKYYIGITSRPIEKRWRGNGVEYKSQYFYRAIQKYGWENFQHIVIANNLYEKEAKNFEKLLISKLQSNNPIYGYNITSGGDGCPDVKRSEEHMNAIINSVAKPIYQFDKDMNFINEFPSAREAVRKLGLKSKSGILDVCNGKGQTAHGYVWRFKKDVINPFDKDSLQGIDYKYNQNRVYQINVITKEFIEYDNSKIASEITGYNYDNIVACCVNKIRTYKGYIWKYKKDIVDIDKYINDSLNCNFGNNKVVLQYDMNMNYINEYPSITEAARKCNLDRNAISKVCREKRESCGGYIWKYK